MKGMLWQTGYHSKSKSITIQIKNIDVSADMQLVYVIALLDLCPQMHIIFIDFFYLHECIILLYLLFIFIDVITK